MMPHTMNAISEVGGHQQTQENDETDDLFLKVYKIFCKIIKLYHFYIFL